MYPQGLDFGGTRHFLRVHTFKCMIICFNLPPTVVCHFYCVMYMHCDIHACQGDMPVEVKVCPNV